MNLERSKHEIEDDASTALWLTKLRWIAIGGQLLVIGFVSLLLKFPLYLPQILALVLLTALSNLGLWFFAKRALSRIEQEDNSTKEFPQRGDLGGVLLFDVIILTGLLYYTGGAANPFVLFYVANIAVAGVVLSRFWAIVISFASILGCLFLLVKSVPMEVFQGSVFSSDAPWGVSKTAFFIAFATCSTVLTYFVSQLALEVRLRDRRLAIAEKDKERAQRLEALATLAAGAGHELASPLSTIAVIAGEMSRTLDKQDIPEKVRRDVGLIREELNRCKDILHRMKSGAGEAAAERLHPVSLGDIIDETIAAMREPHRVDVDMDQAVEDFKALLPKQALSQAFRNLFQNGLDASKQGGHVEVRSTIVMPQEGRRAWELIIEDSGTGMSEDVLRRIGEPFYTTKEVGEGMGLGVFLTRNVIQGLGGTLKFQKRVPMGTTCTVQIPLRVESS